MIKKRVQKTAEKFISKADTSFIFEEKHKKDSPEINTNPNDKKKFLFSIGQRMSDKIDKLSLKSRTIRTCRTDIVKAGITVLEKLSSQEFDELIKDIKA